MKTIAICCPLFCLLISGCIGLGSRESSVMYPDGRIYKVRCQSDGLVDFQQGDVKVKVDNRGPVSQVWAAGVAALGKSAEIVKTTIKGETP